jgi:hypothetical protein
VEITDLNVKLSKLQTSVEVTIFEELVVLVRNAGSKKEEKFYSKIV